MRRGSYPLLTGASALNAAGFLGPNEVSGARQIEVTIKFGPGTTAGGVTVESADAIGYTGTWAAEQVVAWAAASRTHKVIISGGRTAVSARISTAIVGGTVDVSASITD